MRRRAWLLWGILLAAVALAPSARGDRGLEAVVGAFVLAAALLGLSLLPWRAWVPAWRGMPELFVRPGPDERWCAACGRPAPRRGPCASCGAGHPGTRKRGSK